MEKDSPKDKLIKKILLKIKNPFCIFLIIILYFLNNYLKLIKSTELVTVICIILICIVLLKDTIYKCFDRWCKRDETIEKEKTKRKLGIDKKEHSKQTLNYDIDDDRDFKLYEIKHKKNS